MITTKKQQKQKPSVKMATHEEAVERDYPSYQWNHTWMTEPKNAKVRHVRVDKWVNNSGCGFVEESHFVRVENGRCTIVDQ